MRYFKSMLLVVAVSGFAVLLALNLQAQLDTQRKLDALTTALGEQNTAIPAVAAAPSKPTTPIGPREAEYVIEAPDVLLIEAVVRDPVTKAADRLPTQPISGQFLVRPDGTVGLGIWGSVFVSELTPTQAVAVIRKHLSRYNPFMKLPAENLEVIVDVYNFNSKVFYVITDVSGEGEQVYRLPHTGNETVLDAIASVDGLAAEASKRSVRLVRMNDPATVKPVLPVNWNAITQRGETATNYTLRNGDRVYVTAEK